MSGSVHSAEQPETAPRPVADGVIPYHQALNSYLDSLLQQATTSTPLPRNARFTAKDDIEALFDAAFAEPPLEIPSEADVAIDQQTIPLDESGETLIEKAVVAEEPFPGACLLVLLGGFQYAVPLEYVLKVVPFSNRLVRIPGQPDWCLGRARVNGIIVRVIDLQSIVNESQISDADETGTEDPHVILLNQSDLALLVDNIGEVAHLECDDVQWRPDTSTKHWRSGLIKQLLISLLDIEGLCRPLLPELADGDCSTAVRDPQRKPDIETIL